MASFDIDNMGQITVGTGTMLDYEGSQMTYMVTVTASDSTDSDSIEVTIMVTDVMLGEPADTYDVNKDEMISRSEVIAAIDDYFESGGQTPTKDQILGLITLHFAS
jgi:PKD repeat protein